MSGSLTHILFEGASGYGIFTVSMQEEVAAKSKALQDAISDYSTFSRMVQLASFLPFTSAAQALENANDVSEGVLNDHLKNLLQLVIPSAGKGNKKQSKVLLAVSERGLAGAIQGELGIPCDTGERSLELIRGIRLHQEKMLVKGGMQKGDVAVAQLGLGHSYSRGKVKVSLLNLNQVIWALAEVFAVQCQQKRQHDHPGHLLIRPTRQRPQYLLHASP